MAFFKAIIKMRGAVISQISFAIIFANLFNSGIIECLHTLIPAFAFSLIALYGLDCST